MTKGEELWVRRDYREGDEYKIVDLFSKVFNKKMSLEVWRWKYMNNPFGRGTIKLVLDGEKLAGHYAVMPMVVQVEGKPIKACLSVDTMVHPDYRNKGIFADLGNETYEVAAREGAKFVYGFPNSNSYRGFTERLSWSGFGNMSVWQKDILEDDICDLPITGDVRQIERFEDNIIRLWEKVRQDYPIIVPRTKDFLNWRFVLNPAVNYMKFVFLGNEHELLGYTVLKIYQTPVETKGNIVDMLTVNDEEVITRLLNRSYRYFINQGINTLSCWCQDACLFSKVLRKEGFIKGEMERTYFGVRIFDKLDKSLEIVEHFPAWYLTMGNSDVF